MDEDLQAEPQDVSLDWPDSPDARLRISVAGCRLRLHASQGPAWVSGTYLDPTRTLPLQLTGEHGNHRIAQSARLSEIGRRSRAAAPTLDLGLGGQRPFELALDTGASEVDLDLDGVPLTRLTLRLGAGNATLSFSEPAEVPMRRLDVEAGAASVVMRGLGHASPERLVIAGGAASYDLDFGGSLQGDVGARITTAGASVDVTVPSSTPTRIGVVSVLGGLSVGDGFRTWDDSFWTPAGQDGIRPMLSIDASVTLGSLHLTTDTAALEEGEQADGPRAGHQLEEPKQSAEDGDSTAS
jgi:hypothetical protein